MEINRLYVDETGTISGNTGFYILVGCSIKDGQKEELLKLAGQIKYKYWNNDSIVFHSQEIGRGMGAFKNLKDETVRNNFYKDLYLLLYKAPINAFPIVLDKAEVTRRRWGKKLIYRTLNRALFKNFIIQTLGRQGWVGKITIEASSLDRDYYYHEALNHFQSLGIPELGIAGLEISQRITSLSFVNKTNGDVEEQIADLLAYGAECKVLKDNGSKTFDTHSYETNIIKILEAKEFTIPDQTSAQKKRILSGINPFVKIP
ncbi:MAG: DUF3800 domain-containing protein [Candidatus Dojkabacteria bacterium]